MAQDYFTLDEAANHLGVSQEVLKQMAKQGVLRSFQDRGTMRFRKEEVVEVQRRRGGGSDPELPLGDAGRPKATDSPPPTKGKKDGEVFDFSLDTDDQVEIGQEILGGKKAGGKSDSGKGPASPSPKPGSDSDVRLVADGSDLDFHIASDSDVKIVDDAGPKSTPSGAKPAPPSSKSIPPHGAKRKTGAHLDSGVKLIGIDSDSDVKIIGSEDDSALGLQPPGSATDSDVRLEGHGGKGKAGKKSDYEPQLTEEIDLDAEIRKAEEAARTKSELKRAHGKAKQPEFPTTSPFELSEADLRVKMPDSAADAPAAKSKDKTTESSDDFDLTPKKKDSSSDFDLAPAPGDSSSDFDLAPGADSSSELAPGSSDEFQLEVSDESEVALGDLPSAKGRSGINLKDPADSGISLEQGGDGSDEIEFELSLDAESTPKPTQAPKSDLDSDSEFELTIDETGGLAPIEEEGKLVPEDEKDIFETDFDVPALEEESGSEAMALDDSDTDLDSSDFDIALSETDIPAEDESGSQVVALDDEEAAAGAKAAPRPKKKRGTVLLDAEEESSSGIDDLMGEAVEEPEEEEEEEPAVAVTSAVAAPAPEWGVLPVVFLIPCVAVLLLVGFLGFEMIQGVSGYQKPGMLTTQLAKLLKINLPQ